MAERKILYIKYLAVGHDSGAEILLGEDPDRHLDIGFTVSLSAEELSKHLRSIAMSRPELLRRALEDITIQRIADEVQKRLQ